MTRAKKSPISVPSSALTVEQFGEYIVPGVWLDEELLRWPPDVFALVGALLLKSGAYAHAVSGRRLIPRHGRTGFLARELVDEVAATIATV